MNTICTSDDIRQYFKKDPNAFYKNQKGRTSCHSVHFGNQFRFNKAQKESQEDTVSVEQIISYVNELLDQIGVMTVKCPKMSPDEINYAKLKRDCQLDDERDIVWLKFTTDGYVGVVAQSNDINFNFPPNAEAYNKKGKGGAWEYNTSGIIVHKLGKKWDKSFVLVFPLKRKNAEYSRHEIETAVGNYLIDKGVPILDYYSHNY